LTTVVKPSIINTFTFGLTRIAFEQAGTVGASVAFDGLSTQQNFANNARGFIRISPTVNLINDTIWTKQKHTIQGGINFRFITNDRSNFLNSFPSYSFSRNTLRGLGGDLIPRITDYLRSQTGVANLNLNDSANLVRAFGTAYGLALEGSGAPGIRTNLLPREIIQERIVEAKKPWALGAAVGLMAAAAISFLGMFFAWTSFAPSTYASAFARADGVKTQSQAAVSALDEVRQKRDAAITEQWALLAIEDRRFQSLDMLRAVQSLLPRDPAGQVPKNPADRNELHVTSFDCQYFPDLAAWFAGVRQQWAETHATDEGAEGDEEAAPAEGEAAPAPAADGGEAPKLSAEAARIPPHLLERARLARQKWLEKQQQKTAVLPLQGLLNQQNLQHLVHNKKRFELQLCYQLFLLKTRVYSAKY
jgi:hypothetical protein